MARKTPSKDSDQPKRQAADGQDSGYCRAPKHGQIKPGEVRNPWGPKGKPKPLAETDPFEFAAGQPASVNINGVSITVNAETAAHLRNMQRAIEGDPRAHKNVQEERRSRRRAGPPSPTREDLEEEAEKAKVHARFKAVMIQQAELLATLKKASLILSDKSGKLIVNPRAVVMPDH